MTTDSMHPTQSAAVQRELRGWLKAHRQLVGGEFCLVSLMDSLGLDARNWEGLCLDFLYEHWFNHYSAQMPEKKARLQAHLTAAHRAGNLLKQVLKDEFFGKYENVGKKGEGRYGGRTFYRWKDASTLPQGSLANP